MAALLREQSRGWQVYGMCGPGLAATEKTEELRPDIVILSHGHSGCDRLETARQIRARSRRAAVLLFNEARSGHDLSFVVSSGVAGALLKSEAVEEVLFALEAVRRRARYRSRALLRACLPIGPAGERTPAITARELENLRFIARGHSVKETAARLGVSEKTSQTHRTNLYRKFHAHCAVELTRAAHRMGLVEL